MKKNRREKIVICSINIFLFILLCVVGLSDETKDDLGMQLLVSGSDGMATYYHQWAPAFRVIATFYLQRLIPQIAWNYIIQVIFIFISISIICKTVLSKMLGPLGVCLSFFTASILFFQCISVFNFTRTAALVMCAGICLLMREDRKRKWLGLLLFGCTAIIRESVIYISIGFIGIILLQQIANKKGTIKNRLSALTKLTIIPIAGAYMLVLLVIVLNRICVIAHPEWEKIYYRNKISSEVMDWELQEYEERAEIYEEQGITKNDYEMIKRRVSNSDTNYFSDDIYQVVIKQSSQKWKMDKSIGNIMDWGKKIGAYIYHSCFAWYVLSLLFLNIACCKKGKKWGSFLTAICLGAYMILFCIMGRVVSRVEFGVYLCAGITLLMLYDSNNISTVVKGIVNRLYLCKIQNALYVIIAIFTVIMGIKYQRIVNSDIVAVYNYMEENQEFFYFYTKLSQYKAIRNLLLSCNYWNTGNSMYSSDYDFAENTISKYQNYKIENIYNDSVNSKVIRIIDNSYIDMLEKYIQEHYCYDAKAIKVDEIGDYNVYRIISNSRPENY